MVLILLRALTNVCMPKGNNRNLKAYKIEYISFSNGPPFFFLFAALYQFLQMYIYGPLHVC